MSDAIISKDIENLIRNRYQARYNKHGYSRESLGWSKDKQNIRFYALTHQFQLQNSSMLDIGCGFGDILKYISITHKDISAFTYHGIDFVPEFIEKAQEIYKDNNQISFEAGNFLSTEYNRKYDYIISCGIFNHRNYGTDIYELIEATIRKAFNLCNTAVAMDFLSCYVNFKNDDNFYCQPEKILEIAYTLSRNVVLKNDYFPFEFTIILNKDDNYDAEKTYFNTFKKSHEDDFEKGIFVY